MKRYSDLVKKFPSKIVVAGSTFRVPNKEHAALIESVKKTAAEENTDYIIFVEECDGLPQDKKIRHLRKLFPNTIFESTTCLTDSIKKLKSAVLVECAEYSEDVALKSALEGNYSSFKTYLPSAITGIEGRMLMNDLRIAAGLQPIRESIKIETTELREQYMSGSLYSVGDIVESEDVVYLIKKCSSNHLLLQSESGSLVTKWIQDVAKSNKPYTLQRGLFETKFMSSDKIKVARIIASTLGIDDAEKSSNAEMLVNNALRKVKGKAIRPEYLAVLKKMMQTATDVGIKFDKTIIQKV